MKLRRVALLIETSQIYGREIYEGIADYIDTGLKWSVFLEQRELSTQPPKWFTNQHWDGVISRLSTPLLARAIKRMSVPAVDLTDRGQNLGIPRIVSDQAAIGEFVAEYFIARQFRNFAFCGFTKEAWSDGRRQGFSSRLSDSGFVSQTYQSHWSGSQALPWDAEERQIGRWITSLPKPVGIMACNDLRGQQVLESCRRNRINVPREVSVIGVDDDRVLCRLSDPPLSSVVPNARKIGFEAAKLLEQLMRGKSPATQELTIAPLRIASRQSSDTFAVDDPTMADALKLIQESAHTGITVDEIAKSLAVSRSLLERRFREQFDTTPHLQIRQAQLNKAVQLLTDSECTLKQVSQECGFTNIEYFYYLFRKHMGATPGQFRRRYSNASGKK